MHLIPVGQRVLMAAFRSQWPDSAPTLSKTIHYDSFYPFSTVYTIIEMFYSERSTGIRFAQQLNRMSKSHFLCCCFFDFSKIYKYSNFFIVLLFCKSSYE